MREPQAQLAAVGCKALLGGADEPWRQQIPMGQTP